MSYTKSLERSVVIRGKNSPKSQLLKHAMRISELGRNKAGKSLRILGKRLQGYDGKIRNWTQILGFSCSVNRSKPGKIKPECIYTLEK